jgi:hypothetical protein
MIALDLEANEDVHVVMKGSELVDEKEYEEYECRDAEGGRKSHLHTFTIV